MPSHCLYSDDFQSNISCPSIGWQSIQTYLEITKNLVPGEYLRQMNWTPLSPGYGQGTGRNSFRQLLIDHQRNYAPGLQRTYITATTQQSAVADALSSTATLWYQAVNNIRTSGHGSILLQLDAVHGISTNYHQPYTIASCEHDAILGEADARPVVFPITPGARLGMLDTAKFNNSTLSFTPDSTPSASGVEFPGLSRSQIMQTPGPPSENRLRWVELPQDPFNGTAIGAVILLARDPLNTTQEVLTCNIAAGWGLSTLNISSTLGAPGSVQSQIDFQHLDEEMRGWPPKEDNDTEISSSLEEQAVLRTYGFFDLPTFPQRLITLTAEWAKYLNPSVSNAGGNTTVFKTLMDSNLGPTNNGLSIQIILASLVANGLSRSVPARFVPACDVRNITKYQTLIMRGALALVSTVNCKALLRPSSVPTIRQS